MPEHTLKKVTLWQKLILVAGSILLGLVLVEVLVRLIVPNTSHDPFAHNPIIKKQSDHVDFFEPNNYLGHRLKGKGFVGVYCQGIVSFRQIIEDPHRKGRLLVLNLGDSSASGWDSNIISENAKRVKNGEALRSPFHNYKTYSDILADDPRLYVINAGIPGFSSLQGARYLRKLLAEFQRAGVRVDVVTVYFGNNDSIWNGGVEDKYRLPGNGFKSHLIRLIYQSTARFRVVTRVTPSDYGNHINKIVKMCREAGAYVILLEPVVPRVWSPGLRARGLEDELENNWKNLQTKKVGKRLVHSQELFKQGMDALSAREIGKARRLLEQAREEDYLVPRIKSEYFPVLRKISNREKVPLVSVKESIPLDDSAFFIDYCHPVEPANRLIADALTAIIRGFRPRHN